MIFIFGGTLAFFFEFLLLSKKDKSLSHKILTFWMFMLGVHLFLFYFFIEKIDYKYPYLLGVIFPLPLVHGPLLYLYAGSLTGYIEKWKNKYLMHFLPTIIFYCYYFKFFISSGQEKIDFIKKQIENPDLFYSFLYPSILLSGFTYIILTFLLFRKHHKNISNNLSNLNEKNNLHWLRNLIIGLLAIWIVVLVGDWVLDSSVQEKAIFVSVVVFVITIGYFGVRQGNIFVNNVNIPLSVELPVKNQKRYSKSGLKDGQALEIQQILIKLMEEKKFFLDENISLPQLAGLLNIHPNYLSQVINERFQKNFYDFINYYRIEEFKRLVVMEENKKMTFYALACDCGFNSKASFNNSFKKQTGLTPSEFVKKV